ncbi:MAG: hypothetical protein AABX38_00425 [Candidatus Micrarchaeota archaeon]
MKTRIPAPEVKITTKIIAPPTDFTTGKLHFNTPTLWANSHPLYLSSGEVSRADNFSEGNVIGTIIGSFNIPKLDEAKALATKENARIYVVKSAKYDAAPADNPLDPRINLKVKGVPTQAACLYVAIPIDIENKREGYNPEELELINRTEKSDAINEPQETTIRRGCEII